MRWRVGGALGGPLTHGGTKIGYLCAPWGVTPLVFYIHHAPLRVRGAARRFETRLCKTGNRRAPLNLAEEDVQVDHLIRRVGGAAGWCVAGDGEAVVGLCGAAVDATLFVLHIHHVWSHVGSTPRRLVTRKSKLGMLGAPVLPAPLGHHIHPVQRGVHPAVPCGLLKGGGVELLLGAPGGVALAHCGAYGQRRDEKRQSGAEKDGVFSARSHTPQQVGKGGPLRARDSETWGAVDKQTPAAYCAPCAHLALCDDTNKRRAQLFETHVCCERRVHEEMT